MVQAKLERAENLSADRYWITFDRCGRLFITPKAKSGVKSDLAQYVRWCEIPAVGQECENVYSAPVKLLNRKEI